MLTAEQVIASKVSRWLDGPVKTDATFGVTRSRPHCPTGLLNLAVGLFPRAAAICRSPETARAPICLLTWWIARVSSWAVISVGGPNQHPCWGLPLPSAAMARATDGPLSRMHDPSKRGL